MKLIDKDALVAEIERRKQTWKHQDQQYVNGGKDVCDYLLGFLDTLEVKEVDLDKEINTYISSNFFGSQTRGFFANRTKEEPNDQDIALCAKHFFELGMATNNKAQKGK